MIELVRHYVIPAALSVLPPEMTSDRAAVMLLAIGYQESRFTHRVQVGGPARGFWQFEMGTKASKGGVFGVLAHEQTGPIVRQALKALRYTHDPTPLGCYQAIEHNDVLACVFARLLLWTLPDELPETDSEGWRQYLASWRPGKPHPDTWAKAWTVGSEQAI